MDKTMLVLGSDRISMQALKQIKQSHSLVIVIDRSTTLRRVAKLVLRRRLSLGLVVKMFLCELKRDSSDLSAAACQGITSNADLLTLLKKYNPNKVVLFRAGLLISKNVIGHGIPLLNIHCAKVPEYGGLGSIHRALKDRAFEQNATLHQVTSTIDKGRVFDVEPFLLNGAKSYCYNEDIAYQAGLRLLLRTIGH
jgi:methionyl-tRNA formyltransferase